MENLKEKMEFLRGQEKFKTQKKFAEFLEIDHVVYNRIVNEERITEQLIVALRNKFPNLNFNWLIKDKEGYSYLEKEAVKEDNVYGRLRKLTRMLSEVQEEIQHEYDTKNK